MIFTIKHKDHSQRSSLDGSSSKPQTKVSFKLPVIGREDCDYLQEILCHDQQASARALKHVQIEQWLERIGTKKQGVNSDGHNIFILPDGTRTTILKRPDHCELRHGIFEVIRKSYEDVGINKDNLYQMANVTPPNARSPRANCLI